MRSIPQKPPARVLLKLALVGGGMLCIFLFFGRPGAAAFFAKPLAPFPSRPVLLAQQTNRQLLLQAGSAAPGSRGRVPVVLDSQGDENAVSFSIQFDPAILRDPKIELAAPYADAFLNLNDSEAANGRLGILMILPDGGKFQAGVRLLFQINFAITQGVGAGPQPVETVDAPVERLIFNADGDPLPVRYGAGTLVVTPGTEADVAPQPPGAEDGEIHDDDAQRIARYVVGAVTPEPGAEFQRADCAPLASRGDGRLTVADWVQALRYLMGLDDPIAASGPSSTADFDAATGGACETGDGLRELSIPETTFFRGDENQLEIDLLTPGDVCALGFTLSFDPAQVQFARAVLAPELPNATLLVNADQATQGVVGIAISLPPGQTFPAGQFPLVLADFSVLATSSVNKTMIAFEDTLAVRAMAGLNANALCADFTPGKILLTPEVNVQPTLTSLSPEVLFTDDEAPMVLVNGEGFLSTSVANVNGNPRQTEVLSDTQLRATLLRDDVAGEGKLFITVTNPGVGGGTSNALTLFVVQRAPGDNSVPSLFGLSPSTVAERSLPFTLKLTGSGFARDSVIRVNKQDRKTRFVNESQLETTITGADVAVAADIPISVFNPPPGGGTSSELKLQVRKPNPVPHITNLTLTETASGGFTLTIDGTNFMTSSTVRVNGTTRSASFVNATRLASSYSLQELGAAGGTLLVSVTNPPLGGGRSSPASLAITGIAVPANRAPSIFSLTPSVVAVGSASFVLKVGGSGFVPGAVVQLNGRPLTTNVANSSQLTAQINAADLMKAASLEIRVVNPDSGGEKSSPLTLEVKPRTPDPRIADATFVSGSTTQLLITGSNFVTSSSGRVNGSSRSTTYVNPTSLKLTLSSQDLAVAGVLTLTIVNPAPGGGTSNGFDFAVTDPIVPVSSATPSISDIKPRLVSTGAPTFTLLVNGSNFRPGCVIRLNKKQRATQFVNARQLKTVIAATEIGAPASLQVEVFAPDALGGTSNSATLTVKARNPVPQLAAISPETINAGGRDFQLQILGANFVNGSSVRVNGSTRATSFVNSGELSATISASDIATTGKLTNITIFTDLPGGGTSRSASLAVAVAVNPQPSLSSLSPTAVAEGGSAFKLTVAGSRFIAGTVVRVNGAARPTTFVSSTQLTAQILASDIAQSKTLTIQAFTPEPGGGLSGSLSLDVRKRNPVPRIDRLSPDSVSAGSPAFALTINGSNFTRDSVVRVKGAVRSSTFVTSSQLTIQISAFEIAGAGLLNISVSNPAPGGGNTSASLRVE